MTYCVAAAVAEGIVFASDSRTTAGVDDVGVFSKMHVFEVPDERVVIALSAGNLATSQSVVTLLRSRAGSGVHAAATLYDVATLVGETLREVVRRDAPSLEPARIDPGCDFIVGGQVKGEAPRLFHVYAQGNFIEATPDTPYFQLGETKYGKPILERIVTHATGLGDAAKCLLISFDATVRSDLAVGLPIDLLAYEKDRLRVTRRKRVAEGDEYFRDLSRSWSASLRQAFAQVPDVNW